MYHTVLVAVDLSGDSNRVIDTAARLAGANSKLHLVHVVEPVAAAYSMDVHAVNLSELQQETVRFAEQKLQEIGAGLAIDSHRLHTVLGAPAPEIRKLAQTLGADVIVIGSHGHSGWKILLGSTAIKVLHGSGCDVMTVHVGSGNPA